MMDWSRGFARRGARGPEAWGDYVTPRGRYVRLYRGAHNRCRFYDQGGRQVGPEQDNVVPAVAYASWKGWVSARALAADDDSLACERRATRAVRAEVRRHKAVRS